MPALIKFTRVKSAQALLVVLLLLTSTMSMASTRHLTTLPLHNDDPDRLVLILQRYLSPGSSVNHFQNQLVINATDEELTKIKQLLTQLDTSTRPLWIAVRVGDGKNATQQTRQITTPNVVVNNNGTRTETRSTVSIQQRGASSSNGQQQGVRATEGRPALISTGVSAPIHSYSGSQKTTTFTQASSGFYATAWVNDNKTVSVELDQQNDQANSNGISTQQLQSRVSGPLGEWILVGVVQEIQNHQSKHFGNATTSAYHKQNEQQQGSTGIYLKVELGQ